MAKFLVFLCLLFSSSLVTSFAGQENSGHGIIATPINISDHSRTVIGQKFEYPSGVPALYPYHIAIKKGSKTKWHTHQTPLFAYVLSGKLTVDYGSKGRFDFHKGMSFIEALDWCHQGFVSTEEGAEIFALYIARVNSDDKKSSTCDEGH